MEKQDLPRGVDLKSGASEDRLRINLVNDGKFPVSLSVNPSQEPERRREEVSRASTPPINPWGSDD